MDSYIIAPIYLGLHGLAERTGSVLFDDVPLDRRVLRSVPGSTTPGQYRTPPTIMLPLDKHEAVPARPADLSNENWRQHIARQLGLQNVH